MQPVANLLDRANQTESYNESLETMQLRMRDDSHTPAASLLQEMTDNNETYYAMAMRKACEQREHYLERPPSKETIEKYEQLATISIQQQAEIEASDELSFDEFLARY
jgi:glutamate--cysteine ligase